MYIIACISKCVYVHTTILAGEDYVSLQDKLPESTLLIFREGNMNRPLCTEIQIMDDALVEPLEEFQVEIVINDVLAEGVPVAFDTRPAIVKIIDDDNEVIIGFQQIHYKVNEGDGCVHVCVELLAGRLRATDIIYFTLQTIDSSAFGKFCMMSMDYDQRSSKCVYIASFLSG